MGDRVPLSSVPLSQASARINQASDELAALIAELESALARHNFGVEVWLSKPLKSWEEAPPAASLAKRLGYVRVEKKWALAIGHEVDGEIDEIQRLREASREDRLLAMERIDELFAELLAAVQRELDRIGAAAAKARGVLARLRPEGKP
jgi:hypothetical protein